MYIAIQAKCPLILSNCHEIQFCRNILEDTQILNLIKIGPVEAELFHADE